MKIEGYDEVMLATALDCLVEKEKLAKAIISWQRMIGFDECG